MLMFIFLWKTSQLHEFIVHLQSRDHLGSIVLGGRLENASDYFHEIILLNETLSS